MKATVLKDFYDKDTGALHKKGDIVEFEKDRTNNLVKRGLVVLKKDKETS